MRNYLIAAAIFVSACGDVPCPPDLVGYGNNSPDDVFLALTCTPQDSNQNEIIISDYSNQRPVVEHQPQPIQIEPLSEEERAQNLTTLQESLLEAREDVRQIYIPETVDLINRTLQGTKNTMDYLGRLIDDIGNIQLEDENGFDTNLDGLDTEENPPYIEEQPLPLEEDPFDAFQEEDEPIDNPGGGQQPIPYRRPQENTGDYSPQRNEDLERADQSTRKLPTVRNLNKQVELLRYVDDLLEEDF